MSLWAKGLWEWAVRAYAAQGVSEDCLSLQDTAGQNVCLLLWAAWSAGAGRAGDAETLEAACDTARAWDEAAVTPLRAVRRRLKGAVAEMDSAAREAVRAEVKRVELMAEKALLADLEALTPVETGPPRPALERMVAVARAWNGRVPREGLIALASRLPA